MIDPVMRHRRAPALAAVLVAPLLGCAEDAPRAAGPSGPDALDAELIFAEERAVVEVRLAPAEVAPGVSPRDELGGLFTALLESGLTDLADVAAMVDGVPPSPSLVDRLQTGAVIWTGRPTITPASDGLSFSLLLCNAEGLCLDHDARGTRDAPHVAVASLLDQAARTLERQPVAGVAATWSLPQSADAYAVLMEGRSGAVFYGLRVAPSPAARGDWRRDPIARAVYIDPSMAVAWWLRGRDQLRWDETHDARESFTRAAIGKPMSVLFQADEAATLAMLHKWDAAWQAWQDVDQRSPADPRFAVQRARAALHAERVKEALAILDALPGRYQDERAVAELRVAIAEATGESSNYDELLARWQRAAPTDPEPVRRRIRIRVEAGDFREALELTDELERRGQREEAARLAMALAIGLDRFATAADKAEALGLPAVASRVRLREALERDDRAVPSMLTEADDPVAHVVAGERLLRAGDTVGALMHAEAALAAEPYFPEALDLQARALEAAGRGADATVARLKLRSADPAYSP